MSYMPKTARPVSGQSGYMPKTARPIDRMEETPQEPRMGFKDVLKPFADPKLATIPGASGQMAGQNLAEYLRQKNVESVMPKIEPHLAKIPDVEAPPRVLPPLSAGDLGFEVGRRLQPRDVAKAGIERIALDPRSLMPTPGVKKYGEGLGEDLLTALPKAGRTATAPGRLTAASARGIAGFKSKSVKWLKQRGPNRIFTRTKEQPDYIKTTLAPEVYKIYEQKIPATYKRAGDMFNASLRRIKKNDFNLGDTYKNIRNVLKKYSLIDETGSLRVDIKEKEIPQSLKIIANMYDDIARGSVTKAGQVQKELAPTVNKGFFTMYRDLLRKSQKGAGAFKRDVQKVIEGLYDDAEKAGAIGIKKAKDLYRETAKLEDKYPEFTPQSLGAKLQAAVNPKNWKSQREYFRPLLGDSTDEIFNLIKDHMVAQEITGRGPVILGRTGLFKKLIQTGLKGYYEKGLPKKL